MAQTHPGRPRASAASLLIIRTSFVVAVVMFGAITWYAHSQGGRPTTGPNETLTWTVIAVWGVVAVGLMVLSRRYRAAARRDERVSLAIVGWALGEAAALFGGVHYFITGDAPRYGYGLLVFAIALMLFPIPPDEPRIVR